MGLLPKFQEEMIHRAIELNHVTVSEIMTPRGKIFSLPADMPLEQASGRIIEEQHRGCRCTTRSAGAEHIIGVVYSKDVARLMHFRSVAQAMGNTAESGMTLRQVMRDVLVVPETKLAVELLQEFQERRRQIAIVVDEFGSTLGMVTAEDALEQMVGELEDEFDIGSVLPLAAPGGGLLLDGSATSARPGDATALEAAARGGSGDAGRVAAGAAGAYSGAGRECGDRRTAVYRWRRWTAEGLRKVRVEELNNAPEVRRARSSERWGRTDDGGERRRQDKQTRRCGVWEGVC